MAVDKKIESFDDWYVERSEGRDGCLEFRGHTECATRLYSQFTDYQREMHARTAMYYKLLKMANAEVMSPKPDLPNVSSGETSGMILRMARNLVQHTPNVEVISVFDDDAVSGIFVEHTLKSKIIGDNLYSNDMQQNLFASVKNSLALGFDCVIPALVQDADRAWRIEYDNIFYRDVFPEPGARDIRKANEVFVRRYLTKADVRALIRNQVAGWDHAALKDMLKSAPTKRKDSDHESEKHHVIPEGYEIITWYNNYGDPFLTFSEQTKNLLRIEKNKHPLKEHPVFFLILEKDLNQPLGKSQIERIIGRQEFQDLMLNGAMKQYYRNINPAIIGYGTTNAALNLSPGKFNQIGNPNARVEPFEVNTQTLMMYGTITQQNAGSMVQQVGAADQQMATQSGGGGMSQTPQGVEAQQQMVDITTNNFQKAIENFFSRYCSYALTLYFHELKNIKVVTPTADTRRELLEAGFPTDKVDTKSGTIEVDFSALAVSYNVRTVPGSLVEMEDEKQLRILNELFIPLSQAMPALAAAQDQAAIQKASAAMQYIVQKQLELSGSMHSSQLKKLMTEGPSDAFTAQEAAISRIEGSIGETTGSFSESVDSLTTIVAQQQAQIAAIGDSLAAIGKHMGMTNEESAEKPAVAAV